MNSLLSKTKGHHQALGNFVNKCTYLAITYLVELSNGGQAFFALAELSEPIRGCSHKKGQKKADMARLSVTHKSAS